MECQGQYLFGKPRTAFQNLEMGQDHCLFGKHQTEVQTAKPVHVPLFRPFTNKIVRPSFQHCMTSELQKVAQQNPLQQKLTRQKVPRQKLPQQKSPQQESPRQPSTTGISVCVQQGTGPSEEEFEDLSKPCLCQRPLMTVYCRCCGYTGVGRTRRRCERHPQNIYLMDIDKCPQCMTYAGNLEELDAPKESFAPSLKDIERQGTLKVNPSGTANNTLEEEELCESLLINVTNRQGRSVCFQPPSPVNGTRALRRPKATAWPKQ